LDSQETNEHMAQFGGKEIEFDEYRERLGAAIQIPAKWDVSA
jgi:Leu/Phe-tRNA-protein transferase